ncbi:hypothetical protein FQR65_LT15335 [Abscondita terminalis]|nr:hypothetical protein FQR65_LT15335 [Abscondita terminalis]
MQNYVNSKWMLIPLFIFLEENLFLRKDTFTGTSVVVTGLGTINPLGNNVEEFWSNITTGKSAGNKVTYFDSTRFRTQVACEVKDFNPLKYLDRNEIKRSDLFTQYALYVLPGNGRCQFRLNQNGCRLTSGSSGEPDKAECKHLKVKLKII